MAGTLLRFTFTKARGPMSLACAVPAGGRNQNPITNRASHMVVPRAPTAYFPRVMLYMILEKVDHSQGSNNFLL